MHWSRCADLQCGGLQQHLHKCHHQPPQRQVKVRFGGNMLQKLLPSVLEVQLRELLKWRDIKVRLVLPILQRCMQLHQVCQAGSTYKDASTPLFHGRISWVSLTKRQLDRLALWSVLGQHLADSLFRRWHKQAYSTHGLWLVRNILNWCG